MRQDDRIVDSFDGEREIASLEIMPAILNVDGNEIKIQSDWWNKLVDRGQKYWDYLKQGSLQVNYDGKLLNRAQHKVSSTRCRLGNSINMQFQYRGKAIIDPDKYYRSEDPEKRKPESMDDRDCSCDACVLARGKRENSDPFGTFQWLNPRPKKDSKKENCEESCKVPELTPKHFFLLPHDIPGFILKSREWSMSQPESWQITKGLY